MEAIIFLIPLALILGSVFVALFIWATHDHQFDDLTTPASRILIEDKNINLKTEGLKDESK
ncbi:MAG: cbb3-type cytochrome oxidase assembly protein CcoS [Oligoflexia bacterium]|nr:cbb3-type cytochrome oxidase assembly protein CcoS [Oligoflexia bacterium]